MKEWQWTKWNAVAVNEELGASAVMCKPDGAAVISNDTSNHVVDTIRQVLGITRQAS